MNNPLKGKTIISTRPIGKSEELKKLFLSQESVFIEFPLIELNKKEDFDFVKFQKTLLHCSHVIFSSAPAFYFFLEILKEINKTDALNDLKILSIGYKTSTAIINSGFNIAFDAQAKTGKEFVAKLIPFIQSTKAFSIWPTGDLSPNHLITELSKISQVKRINIYSNSIPKTINTQVLNKIKNKQYDLLITTSPSAIKNLKYLTNMCDHNIACIGQTTANAAIQNHIKPICTALEPTSLGIFNAVLHHYSNNKK